MAGLINIHSAQFIGSYTSYEKMPYPRNPEYAFIGRSNVGKSSLINCLTGKKELAKISKKPGKTRQINLYLINQRWNIVDLPGYGYAKVSKTERKQFLDFITAYFRYRPNLVNIFVLIDANISPQETDLDFIRYLGENQWPFSIVFTKTDKSSQSMIHANIQDFKKAMMEDWEELPPVFTTSSRKGTGRKELLQYIDECNRMLVKKS